ncbi:MAG: Unknown protein [uncultured Sulfurovum sp.]|uniref:EF-hand domain-containing protein n=1 Tax=uncultured Sulfurovum sp. TaxID=269237 RepID=A0A6S6TW21_9BACT|nr:MAG: Unknown protein [uncultured Sulfurovum sp.]
MKNNTTLKTIAALTIILLSQPIFATESNVSDNCLVPKGAKNLVLDAVKFTSVWLKVKKDEKSEKGSQKHLEEYIKKALADNNGTIDVEKFSALWDKAGNNKNTNEQAHLQDALIIIVDKASGEVYTHTK